MDKFHQFILVIVVSAMLAPLALVIGTHQGKKMRQQVFTSAARESQSSEDTDTPSASSEVLPIYFSTPVAIKAGQETYLQLCAGCHGEKGDGNGPAGAAFNPPPRSFLDAESPWKNGLNPAELYKTLTEGIPGTGMVSFSALLSEEKRWEVIHFIHSLPGMEGRFEPVTENNVDMIKKELGLS